MSLTFERYMRDFLTKPEEMRRSDIINGVRTPPVSSDWQHQRVLGEVLHGLSEYEKGRGKVIPSPFDLLIRQEPLQVRQPDLFFISNNRLELAGGPPQWGPLRGAPELVVEVLSIGETLSGLAAKLDDYVFIGVSECWIVKIETQTVEVLRLTSNGAESAAVYGRNESVRSEALPDLAILVSDIFNLR